MKEKTDNLDYSRCANDKMVFPASVCTRFTILLIYSICIIFNVAENIVITLKFVFLAYEYLIF